MLSFVKNVLSCILLILVIFFGYNYFTGPGLGQKIDKAIGNERKITSVDISNRLTGIQELATAKYEYESIESIKDKWYGSEKNLIVGFRGIIKFGYDLSQIKGRDIRIENKTLSIVLPEPKILSNEIDSNFTKPLIEDNGLWNKIDPKDILELERKGKERQKNKAINDPKLKQAAENNAKMAIELLAKSIDKDVQVKIINK